MQRIGPAQSFGRKRRATSAVGVPAPPGCSTVGRMPLPNSSQVLQRLMAATAAFVLVWPTSLRPVPIIQTYVAGPRRWRRPSTGLALLLATLMSSVAITKKAETAAAE